MTPLVSILIPAYKAEATIPSTIQSTLAQSWPRIEVIVVVDGSLDRTHQVAESAGDARVRVITQANQGAAAARNHALQLSQGDFIQWLDADDLLSPDKVSRQMEVLLASGDERLLASCGWVEFLHRPAPARALPTPLWADLTPTEWLLRKLELNLHMQTATWLTSRSLTLAAGPWNTAMLGDDDGEFFCRVLLKSSGVRFVPGEFVYYRATGATSLSYVAGSDRKLEAHFASMRLHIGYLRSLDDSPRARRACVTYLQNWLGEFYPERPDIVAAARQLADELGGTLDTPAFSWKYAWLGALFGPQAAKRLQVRARRSRWNAQRRLDKLLAAFDGRGAEIPGR
jgi:glycosyltransferase involved in cell wall biosynthesis